MAFPSKLKLKRGVVPTVCQVSGGITLREQRVQRRENKHIVAMLLHQQSSEFAVNDLGLDCVEVGDNVSIIAGASAVIEEYLRKEVQQSVKERKFAPAQTSEKAFHKVYRLEALI